MFSCQTYLFSYTIASFFHYVFLKNEFQFHDLKHHTFGPLDIRKEVWYSFYIFLFLDHELHLLEQLNSFGNLLISILQHPGFLNKSQWLYVFLLRLIFFLLHLNKHFKNQILQGNFSIFFMQFLNIIHLVHQIIQWIYEQVLHFHIQIKD